MASWIPWVVAGVAAVAIAGGLLLIAGLAWHLMRLVGEQSAVLSEADAKLEQIEGMFRAVAKDVEAIAKRERFRIPDEKLEEMQFDQWFFDRWDEYQRGQRDRLEEVADPDREEPEGDPEDSGTTQREL